MSQLNCSMSIVLLIAIDCGTPPDEGSMSMSFNGRKREKRSGCMWRCYLSFPCSSGDEWIVLFWMRSSCQMTFDWILFEHLFKDFLFDDSFDQQDDQKYFSSRLSSDIIRCLNRSSTCCSMKTREKRKGVFNQPNVCPKVWRRRSDDDDDDERQYCTNEIFVVGDHIDRMK